jgi:4-methyl-5(b-hydroxyethyl)-thiazole monophosphate biosynthesis
LEIGPIVTSNDWKKEQRMKILVPLAEGVEEMEAVIVMDTLRRAGFEVVGAGLKAGPLTASRGVRLIPDVTLDEVRALDFDAIVLPGGKGVALLKQDARVLEAVRVLHQAGRWVCAVCAAPLVLQAAGILAGRAVTCFPGVADQLTAATRSDARVVVDGTLITSQGAGTSLEFALEIVRRLGGETLAQRVGREMVAF